MNTITAQAQAKRYKVPKPDEYVKLPSVEALHFYLLLNNLEVVGWRGNLLVVRPRPQAVSLEE